MLEKVGVRAEPRLLLIGAEFLDFLNTSTPGRPGAQTLGSRWQPNLLQLKALLTLQATRDSLETLRLQHARYPPTLTYLGFNPLSDYEEVARTEGYYAMFRQRAEENSKMLQRIVASLSVRNPLDENELVALRKALALAVDWKSEVHLLIYPYHAQLLLMFEDLGLWPAFEQFKRQLVAEAEAARAKGCNVSVWDFSGASGYATQPIPGPNERPGHSAWYWEAGHFKKALGDIMVGQVLGGPASFDAAFGRRLDQSNIDGHLASQRAELRVLRQAHANLALEVRNIAPIESRRGGTE